MAVRFYTQYTETSILFGSKWPTSWQIFDREWLTKEGSAQAICMCVSRNEANRIRDALNACEPEQSRMIQSGVLS